MHQIQIPQEERQFRKDRERYKPKQRALDLTRSLEGPPPSLHQLWSSPRTPKAISANLPSPSLLATYCSVRPAPQSFPGPEASRCSRSPASPSFPSPCTALPTLSHNYWISLSPCLRPSKREVFSTFDSHHNTQTNPPLPFRLWGESCKSVTTHQSVEAAEIGSALCLGILPDTWLRSVLR